MKEFYSRSRQIFSKSFGLLAVSSICFSSFHYYLNSQKLHLDSKSSPKFTRKELSKHKCKEEGGIWVSYKNGVYDVTNFIDSHPGGDKILLAAGSSVEPFWKVYTIHDNDQVRQILEQYRIGDLDMDSKDEEAESKHGQSMENINDPFLNDPSRSPILVVRSSKPFNAETPPSLLADYFLTPTEIFYKRNHLPIPDLNKDEFRLEITGESIEKPISLTLDDLRSFPQVQVVATLQCAGNRRQEMYVAGPVQGLAWEGGAIGNAVWEGVYLRDVLEKLGVTKNKTEKGNSPMKHVKSSTLNQVKHVQFEGLDGYGASVPLSKILNENGDVLLAFKMNGEELTRDHGYPLRVIIPGHVAARSVKWVGKIILSQEESHSHWQRNDYKGFSPSSDWDKLEWDKSPSIQEMPIQSGILEPVAKSTVSLDQQTITVKGYAWSGGGRGVVRVDVSADGGKTWNVANLREKEIEQTENREWAWTQWEADINLPEITSNENIELVCKAVDSSYNVQPNEVDGIYNKRGVLSNAWHRVNIYRKHQQ